MSQDYQKQQELEEARRKDIEKNFKADKEAHQRVREAMTPVKTAKDLARMATPWGAFSLMRQGNIFTDWMYGAALMAAILKDLSDFAIIGSFPLIGTVITFLVSIFIGLMMLLGSIVNQKGKRHYKAIRAYLILGGATIVESFMFGLNFIPVETLSVLFVWALLLSARKQAEKERRQAGKLAEAY